MRGYWNNPEETTLAFRDGFFRTGDVGRQDADGYFYILDRLKDMIVTGGENVYSGEVEAVLYGDRVAAPNRRSDEPQGAHRNADWARGN